MKYHDRKTPFTFKCTWQLCDEIFLRYLDYCYVNPGRLAQIKELPSIISCELIRSIKKLLSKNIPHLE